MAGVEGEGNLGEGEGEGFLNIPPPHHARPESPSLTTRYISVKASLLITICQPNKIETKTYGEHKNRPDFACSSSL